MSPADLAEISRYAELMHQRFGQFIDNALSIANVPLFYATNEDIIEWCRTYYNAWQAYQNTVV